MDKGFFKTGAESLFGGFERRDEEEEEETKRWASMPRHALMVLHVPFSKKYEVEVSEMALRAVNRVFSQAPGFQPVIEVHTNAPSHSSLLTIDETGVDLFKNINGYNGPKTQLEDIEASLARAAELEYFLLIQNFYHARQRKRISSSQRIEFSQTKHVITHRL